MPIEPSRKPGDARRSAKYGGWRDPKFGRYADVMPKDRVQSSWLRPTVLWQSRNDKVASWIRDGVIEQRRAWVKRRAAKVDRNFTIDRSQLGDFAFILLGDTGEGDASQWAVAEAMKSLSEDTAFMFIASDVIYPTGELSDYERKFLDPYQFYKPPVYAVPGNHDWYDNLQGFMLSFCDEDGPAPKPIRTGRARLDPREPVRRLLWRKSSGVPSNAMQTYRSKRRLLDPPQPGPYFAIDCERVRIVGVDTGINNVIDADQARWLREVSAGPKPKILITGKPIVVNNQHEPSGIEGSTDTIDDIVRAAEHRYVAVFGGDIHNYQRYPVDVGGRVIQYVVCGGGGAFMHATHTIPKVKVCRVVEDDFRCYPLRGDSLAFYSRLYNDRIGAFIGETLTLEPDVASYLLGERYGIPPSRETAKNVEVTDGDREAFERVVGRAAGKGFQRYVSEFFDNNRPPFFKHFLRLEVTGSTLTVRCLAVTGWPEDELDPPEADCFSIDLETLESWTIASPDPQSQNSSS
jgi:hypothetical protein